MLHRLQLFRKLKDIPQFEAHVIDLRIYLLMYVITIVHVGPAQSHSYIHSIIIMYNVETKFICVVQFVSVCCYLKIADSYCGLNIC